MRYRYDWHIGAMPERYTYDKTGQKQPLNELSLIHIFLLGVLLIVVSIWGFVLKLK